MVQIGEGVPQVLDGVLQALNQVVALVKVVNDELISLLVHIVGQVGLLVLRKNCGCAVVRVDKHLLLCQILSNVGLHLFKERLGLLDVNVELGELSVELVSILISDAFRVRLCSVTKALEKLV